MMTSDGRVHAVEEIAPNQHRTVYSSPYPIPENCDHNKILKAFQKLLNARPPIKNSDAALLPLTPMEKGFVLGALAEYHARRS
jgi:hypothetical protein